ncbi:hypothetical protein [Herbiconiux sp. YIM B11900]|uniref:hypothetical protein n=1 Tax=Herbiconiux sp. YIM B11900 TaxID=3404131 RepID=UPI003F84DE92
MNSTMRFLVSAIVAFVTIGTSSCASTPPPIASSSRASASEGGASALGADSAAQDVPASGWVADASWPPVVVDPDPIEITIPTSWSEADKEQAREWVTVQQNTRACVLDRGEVYIYHSIWNEFDETGAPVDAVPPSNWASHFEHPFMSFMNSVVVCFDRALTAIGRPTSGPLEFAPRAPRFEPADFADPATLDIPAEWSADEQASARTSWEVELVVRQCMSDAGYPSYGQPPYWKMTDAIRGQDRWTATIPAADRAAAEIALDGYADNIPYDPDRAGCWGQANAQVGD